MRASVVVVVRNAPAAVARCLAALDAHAPPGAEILLVDNASSTATRSLLRDLETRRAGVRVLENRVNLGWPVACNQGMAVASGEVVVLLNSDAEIGPGAIEMLASHAAAAGLAGPMGTHVFSEADVPDPDAWRPEPGRYVHRLVGFCLAISRQVIDAIGGMDPRYGLGCYEDDDYCLRAQLAGFELWLAGDVLVRHEGRASFCSDQIDLSGLLAANHKHFLFKWRGLGLSGSTVAELLASAAEHPIGHEDLFVPLPLLQMITGTTRDIDERVPETPRISLCMIARDEEPFLADCLRSARGAVDEIVVVDTGSTDRTVAIAEAFGARVGCLAWDDDFSAARNAALDMATGDWILVLDADERLAPGSADELRWLSHCTTGMAYICHVEGDAGDQRISNPVLRFFRRDERLRYQGRIHEQPTWAGAAPMAVDLSGVRIWHLGYEPDLMRARGKYARNLRIAQLDAGDAYTAAAAFNLARAYWDLEDYAAVEQHAAAARAMATDPDGQVHAAIMQIAAIATRDLDGAIREARALRQERPALPRVAFFHGQILAAAGRWPQAMVALDWRLSLDLARYLSGDFAPPDMGLPGVSLRQAVALYVLAAGKAGREDLIEGYLRASIAVTPLPDPALLTRLAKLLVDRCDWQAAGETLNRALKIAPTPEGWSLMARICHELGLPDMAADAAANAVALVPQEVLAHVHP